MGKWTYFENEEYSQTSIIWILLAWTCNNLESGLIEVYLSSSVKKKFTQIDSTNLSKPAFKHIQSSLLDISKCKANYKSF